MFYMPNGSIPAYMNEYPISFPETLYAYASPHLTAAAAAGLPHSNPSFAPYPQFSVYRPSSLYFPPAVSMHPSTSNHPQNPNAQAPHHLPLNHPAVQSSAVNLQQGQQTNAPDTSQYSNQQASIQSQQQQQQQQHSNQAQTNQPPPPNQAHHHSSRLNSNNSNNPNSNHPMGGGSTSNQPDGGGYQSQYHLHHLNAASAGAHHNTHQHIHHSHQASHAQANLAGVSSTSNHANQQHTPVFMPYMHPLSLHQYNHGLASAIASGVGPVPFHSANTTQPHQTSLAHQSHYSHQPLSSQPNVNQFQMNPNWNHQSQWR